MAGCAVNREAVLLAQRADADIATRQCCRSEGWPLKLRSKARVGSLNQRTSLIAGHQANTRQCAIRESRNHQPSLEKPHSDNAAIIEWILRVSSSAVYPDADSNWKKGRS